MRLVGQITIQVANAEGRLVGSCRIIQLDDGTASLELRGMNAQDYYELCDALKAAELRDLES